jgi:hypothetical protein
MFLLLVYSLHHFHKGAKRGWLQMENCMTTLKFVSAALIAAAMLATPAVARESQARHPAENANASITPGARYIGKDEGFRGYESHDVWGRWGTYYGPMVPSVP